MAAQELFTTPLFNDANLQDYYRMEGNSNDAKGIRNGSDTSMSYSSGNGKFGQGGGFNGSSSKIDLGSAPFTGTGDFTVTSWIKTSVNSATEQEIFILGNGSNNQTCQWGVLNGTVIFTVLGVAPITGSFNVSDNVFHNVIIRFRSGNFQYFVDGTNDSTENPVTLNITAGANHHIGSNNGSGNFFNGSIDDIAFFNRALSSSEITQLFNGFSVGAFLFNLT